MTEAERQAIELVVITAREELEAFEERVRWASLAELYEFAKPVHTAALGIWSTVVDLLRAQQGLNKREPETDAINLQELFGTDSGNTQAPSDLET